MAPRPTFNWKKNNPKIGLVLFVLGVLFMGVGNILSLPAHRYERQCGIRHTHIFKIPAPEEFIAGNLFVARTPAHFYSIENALLFAGFVILIIGLFILL